MRMCKWMLMVVIAILVVSSMVGVSSGSSDEIVLEIDGPVVTIPDESFYATDWNEYGAHRWYTDKELIMYVPSDYMYDSVILYSSHPGYEFSYLISSEGDSFECDYNEEQLAAISQGDSKWWHDAYGIYVTPGERVELFGLKLYKFICSGEDQDVKIYAVSGTTVSTPTPTPTPTTGTAKLTDDFAEVKGDFPALFSDNDDSTYVRGGLGAPNSDYEAKFTMKVQETDTLKFNAKVNCLSGYCGGKTKCGFLFFAKNHETGEYDQFSGAPWDPPGIHEYVLTLEDASKYIRNGEVDFFFSFHCNMDGYVMEFKQMGVAPPYTAPTTGTAKVYVNNEDDDDLDISLYIDGNFTDTKIVSSGSSKYYFGDYELSPGDYKFKIKWQYPDTYEWYEDETTAAISVGEPTTVTLTVEKHVTVKAVANIMNYDDDELEIALYMEEEHITTKNIPHWSQHVEYITVLPGTYTFKIQWEDPDTRKEYEIENTVTFKPGDIGGRKVNLRVPKHQATTAEVYVMNKYSDTLEIDLEIDYIMKDRKKISPSSYMRFYGSYEVSPDSHIFDMYWADPDTGKVCIVEKTETFEEEEVKEIKLIAEKQGPVLEVDVKPYVCVLEAGDQKYIEITIKNTGDTTAESVDEIIVTKNKVTASIGGSKTPYLGDIKPGETWTEKIAVPYIEAKKEGETTIEVKVRSNNTGDVLKNIQVRVVKPGTIATELSSLGESQPKRPSSEVTKDVLASTNEFLVMYEEIEEEISDSFSKDGIDAKLIVQSSGKAGNAVEGKKVKIALKITNKNDKAISVKAAIIPSEFFRYKEGKYDATLQKIDRNTWDFVETIDVWSWKNYACWVQFHLGGKAYVLEPYHGLIFSAEITPEQTGYLAINGEIYYEPIETQTLFEFYIHYLGGQRAVETELDDMEHVTLTNSIYVEEKKKCYLRGWICP